MNYEARGERAFRYYIKRYDRLYKECGGWCYLCGRSLYFEYSQLMFLARSRKYLWPLTGANMGPYLYLRNKINLNKDHVVPKSLGGKRKDNLRMTHLTCNFKRGIIPIEEYVAKTVLQNR